MTAKLLTENLDLAVVGAGASAAAFISAMELQGPKVAVFEKSRGPGGRLSVRRTSLAEYNHGGLPSSAEAATIAERLCGDVSTLKTTFNPANSEIKRVLSGVSCFYEKRIHAIDRSNQLWTLLDVDGQTLASSRALVVALPAPQALDLLAESLSSSLKASLAGIHYEPAWALMLSFGRAVDEAEFNAKHLFPRTDFADLRQGKCNSEGDPIPSRAWSLIASSTFSRRTLEWEPQAVCREFMLQTGIDATEVEECLAHRWRYAKPSEVLDQPGFWCEKKQLGIAGDYYGSHATAPLQRAKNSGQWLAGAIRSSLA